MVKCNSMPMIAVIAVLMLVCAKCTQAAFSDCYNECVEGCPILGKRRARCIADCIFQCKAKQANSCNVHCTTNRCTRFGKDANKVEACFNVCDQSSC
ncbi:protein TAP1-like [Salvia hispanica]|uniref:protein TAP1-like n=1 Tax=Salvia hispanica TaxID=49212 RepID=UPI0020090D5B|nr:protein TAP1-like [Salvia hispanica]